MKRVQKTAFQTMMRITGTNTFQKHHKSTKPADEKIKVQLLSGPQNSDLGPWNAGRSPANTHTDRHTRDAGR